MTSPTGRVLVDSAADRGSRSPVDARATLDPLAVDPVLITGAVTEPAPAEAQEVCASPCRRWTVPPTGVVDARVPPRVGLLVGARARVEACLRRAGLPAAEGVTGRFEVVVSYRRDHDAVGQCAAEVRRRAYADTVAPSALLFVSGEQGSASVLWDLSGASQARIVLLAGGVLLATLLLCLLCAGTVVRPLRRMAVAAHRAGDGDLSVRVPVRSRDEVGEVARAFNRMADRRQQLEDARRRMVSDVSHELRTPLANVRGWLEAAQDGLVEPDPRLLASLHEETLYLQRLVDDLHDLSLGDAGELRLIPVEIEVAVFLEQVADAFRGAAEAAGVAVLTEAAPDAVVHADPVRIRQAVANLVANALRHTPAGGRVTLRGGDGVLEVADTGEGIAADDLPHVFERFRRADAARSRTTGGSGLGLAIVRQIIEAHGGTAAIESTPGAGTVVRLTLPAGDPDLTGP